MNKLRPLLIMGTRPEAIKMAPVVLACSDRSDDVDAVVCLTGQHREMLQQVIDWFELPVDTDLELMAPNQTLASLTAKCIESIDSLITRFSPDCIVAQGDTTTVMAAAVAAFYRQLPFVHVEAGLRTGNLYAPWPEEFNRRVAGIVTSLHCAPTQRAKDALLAEQVDPATVRITGNTVIDALLETCQRQQARDHDWQEKYSACQDRTMVLITGHRRENFGAGFEEICRAIATLASRFADHAFVYPVHLNPNVHDCVHEALGHLDNVHLVPPASYPEFVWLMNRCKLILTDSGGVQEEAPTLRKPVLVMRETTERPEAVDVGAAQLVGTCAEKIVESVSTLLTDDAAYESRQVDVNPYGDGRAAQRIVDWMLERPWKG